MADEHDDLDILSFDFGLRRSKKKKSKPVVQEEEPQAVSFYEYYRNALSSLQWNCTDLHKAMKESGEEISVRTLQRYYSKESIPTYEKAVSIFKHLHVEVDPDLLKQSLVLAVEDKELLSHGSKYLNATVHIRLRRLSRRLSNDEAIRLALKERIRDVQGSDDINFNRYIAELIRKDMDENILPRVRIPKKNDD